VSQQALSATVVNGPSLLVISVDIRIGLLSTCQAVTFRLRINRTTVLIVFCVPLLVVLCVPDPSDLVDEVSLR
jgi:hypothetical protein